MWGSVWTMRIPFRPAMTTQGIEAPRPSRADEIISSGQPNSLGPLNPMSFEADNGRACPVPARLDLKSEGLNLKMVIRVPSTVAAAGPAILLGILTCYRLVPLTCCQRRSSALSYSAISRSTAARRASPAKAMFSQSLASSGQWLSPPLLFTNSIPTSVISAITCPS